MKDLVLAARFSPSRLRAFALCLLAAALFAAPIAAQGPQEWLKRILDPATIGVTPPPGAVMNRKLTVDYLSKTDPPATMAIYLLPLDQLPLASAHFEKTLAVKPEVSGSGLFEIHKFVVPAKGLTIICTRSQFVDNKLQIMMTYTPGKS
jgi:hypothetical protein